MPNEIIQNIMSNLNGRDLQRLAGTSQRMAENANRSAQVLSRLPVEVAPGVHLEVDTLFDGSLTLNEAARFARPQIQWLQREIMGELSGVMPKQVLTGLLPTSLTSRSMARGIQGNLLQFTMARLVNPRNVMMAQYYEAGVDASMELYRFGIGHGHGVIMNEEDVANDIRFSRYLNSHGVPPNIGYALM